jgi:hypothetical protein
MVQGNYFQGGLADGTDPHCRIMGNKAITGEADVPPDILKAAGIEPAYQHLLQWMQVPPPNK